MDTKCPTDFIEREHTPAKKREFSSLALAKDYLNSTYCGHGRIEDDKGSVLHQCRCGGGEVVVVKAATANDSIDPAKWRRMSFAEQNRVLCESRVPHELIETASAQVRLQANESAVSAGIGWVNVSKADSINLNRRIYPAGVMGAAIERAQSKIEQGMLGGAVDHPGMLDGGVLKHSPIIWRGLKLDSATGDVQGLPEIVEGHSDGANLKALVDAGRALPFSTRGNGSAHLPTAEEKAKYSLKDGIHDDVVIIDENFDLNAIDPVDNPSCVTAYKPGTTPSASADDSTQSNLLETPMKTLAELKAAHPELFKIHETAITEAVAAASKPLTDQITALTTERDDAKKVAESVNAFIDGFKESKLVKLPFKEVGAKELTARIETLTGELTVANAATAAEKAKVTAKEAEIEKQKAAQLEADRKASVLEKLDTLLTDNPFSEQISGKVKGAEGKPGLIEQATFDLAALEAFVTEKTAEYEEIADGAASEHRELSGLEKTNKKPAAGGNGKLTAEEVRKQYAL